MSRPPAGLHILWLTERYPPQQGGMAVSCDRQVQGLRRSEHRVDVVAFCEPSADRLPRGPSVLQKDETEDAGEALLDTPLAFAESPLEVGTFRETARDNGIDIHVPRGRELGNAAQRVWLRILQEHRTRPYTHAVGFGANFPGFLAVTFSAWLEVPSLVLVRGNDFDRDYFEPRAGAWVRDALSRADAVGVVARSTARRIQALYPQKQVSFTPNGIEASSWTLLPSEAGASTALRQAPEARGRVVIGLFGELKFKKRLPFLLEALRDTGLMDRVCLLIVGHVDEASRQLLSDPILAPASMLRKFVPRDELPSLYAACDFIALPSLFEGMPNVLLEAMAMGVVPLVSDAGALGDVVAHEKTGFVFPAEDRTAAGAVLRNALLLEDAERRAMAAKASTHVATHFSAAAELETLTSLLTSLSEKRASRSRGG